MPERSLQQRFLEWSDLFATMKQHLVNEFLWWIDLASRNVLVPFLAPLLLNYPHWYPLKLDLLGTWSVARILPFSIHRCSRERALGDSNVLPWLIRLCMYLYINRQFTVAYWTWKPAAALATNLLWIYPGAV